MLFDQRIDIAQDCQSFLVDEMLQLSLAQPVSTRRIVTASHRQVDLDAQRLNSCIKSQFTFDF